MSAMTDFGGKLREAREGRGMSLREIADRTRIAVAALEALERNDVSKLPGGIFSRSFVRSYAAEVGLNPDEAVKEFLERFQDEPAPPARTVQIPEQEIAFERRKQLAARVFLAVVAAMIILSAVVMYLVLRNRPDTQAGRTEGTVEMLKVEG